MMPADGNGRRSRLSRLARGILFLPGRWWLWLGLGLLTMALHLWALPLAMHLALLPAAKDRGSGWMVARYDNLSLAGVPYRIAFEPPLAHLTLEKPDTSLSAYAVITVPHDGLYDLGLACDDYGSILLDGRLVFDLEVLIAADNHGSKTVSMTAGPHLVRVDLSNLVEKGNFVLSMRPYGQGGLKDLEGEALACPDLSNIGAWWLLLETAPRLDTPGMVFISLGLMLLLLPRARKKGAAAWAAACAVIVLPSMLIPGGLPPKEPFNDRGIIARLKSQQPEFVFIGNSIVESCNDPDHMRELLGGRPVANVITYGGFSAFDYIMLKNLVLGADIKPKAVFFFFRGTLLTMPLERTEGVFAEALQALSHDDETVFEQVMAGRIDFPQRAHGWAKGWLRVSGQLPGARESVARAALWLAIPPGSVEKAHKRRWQLQDKVNDRFELGRLRGEADDMVAKEKERKNEVYDFDAEVGASFLPPILDLCRQAGVRPIFVRAQERPTARGPLPDDPRLTRYLERARAYLEARGAGYYDFTGDPELPLSMYAAGDHIAYPARFSELMLKRMPWAFK